MDLCEKAKLNMESQQEESSSDNGYGEETSTEIDYINNVNVVITKFIHEFNDVF